MLHFPIFHLCMYSTLTVSWFTTSFSNYYRGHVSVTCRGVITGDVRLLVDSGGKDCA